MLILFPSLATVCLCLCHCLIPPSQSAEQTWDFATFNVLIIKLNA